MNQNPTRKWWWVKHIVESMKRILAAILFSIAPIALWAQASDELVVKTLSQKKYDWLIGRQADSLDRMLDERLQFVHSNGWVQTKREVLDDMRSGKLVYQRVTVKEAIVRLYDKTAVVNGLGTFEGVNSGNAFKLDLRYTEVYVYDRGRWTMVSRHSNRMP